MEVGKVVRSDRAHAKGVALLKRRVAEEGGDKNRVRERLRGRT